MRIVSYDELDITQKERLKAYYLKEVYPILTPLAVDPGHPFPFISNLSLSLAVLLRDTSSGDVQFARVKVPQTRPRWVPIDFPLHFVPLEQIITANLDSLFKGMEVVAVYPFRVTRNADIARNHRHLEIDHGIVGAISVVNKAIGVIIGLPSPVDQIAELVAMAGR